jgi:hypothetical protein
MPDRLFHENRCQELVFMDLPSSVAAPWWAVLALIDRGVPFLLLAIRSLGGFGMVGVFG